MLEWLKRHAWKACVPPKGIASSNLALSAKPLDVAQLVAHLVRDQEVAGSSPVIQTKKAVNR